MKLLMHGMQVLAPHIKITMIPPPGADAEQAGAAAAPKATRRKADQEELVPDLEAFLKANPIKSIKKVAEVHA